MIGDTDSTWEMARAADVRAVAVSWGYHRPDRLHGAGRVAYRHDMNGMRDCLLRVNRQSCRQTCRFLDLLGSVARSWQIKHEITKQRDSLVRGGSIIRSDCSQPESGRACQGSRARCVPLRLRRPSLTTKKLSVLAPRRHRPIGLTRASRRSEPARGNVECAAV